MDKIKQRIAIAKACGWGFKWDDSENCFRLYTDKGAATIFADKNPDAPLPVYACPDYLNDLNAMHEALLTLTTEQRHEIVYEIGWVLGTPNPNDWEYYYFLYISASELAEAFLKTLNLWEGGSND